MKRTLDETFYVDFNMVAQSDHAYYTSDDLCVVTRFSPHHDFRSIRMGDLLLVFCHKGRMRLSLNGREHRLGSTDLLICLPSALISDVEQSADCEGGMVFVSKQLLEDSFRNAYNLFDKYLYISENPVIHLGEAGLQSSSLCFQALREKIAQTERPYQKEIVTLLLRACFFELMGCIDAQTISAEAHARKFSQGERLVKEFLKMLGTDEVKQRFVTDYASRLCVTPKYLSAVCKNVTGKTAAEWIDEFVVREARHLLLNTDKTIKEISLQLGFPNLSFFGKYIKAKLGTSPTLFRASARQGE